MAERAFLQPLDPVRREFEQRVLVHLDAAYRFALQLSRSPQDAEDIVQDAMLRAFRAFEPSRVDTALPWLLTIVRNCFLTQRGRRPAGREDELPIEDTADALQDPRPNPESAAHAASEQLALNLALARLSDEHREVLALREIEELAYQEIAEVIDVKIGTVMSRLARAREALREQWFELFGKVPA